MVEGVCWDVMCAMSSILSELDQTQEGSEAARLRGCKGGAAVSPGDRLSAL